MPPPRRSLVLRALLCCLIPLLDSSLSAQDRDWSKVEVKGTEVSPGLVLLVGAGGNLLLSHGADGALLIDDQYAPLHEKILQAVRLATAQPVRFVVNTHWHGDHTGGNEKMGALGSVLVAHENVRKRMSVEQWSELWKRATPPSPAKALPVVTFTDAVSFHWNGDTIRVEHLAPAHTDGDSLVWFEKANVLHTGDAFFNGRYPYIDVDSGGSIDGMIAGLEHMVARSNDQTRIVPGHGEIARRADVSAYRVMLSGVRDAVAKLIAEGKTLEQVAAAKPTAPWDPTYDGKSSITGEILTATVYRSLTQKTTK
jgi:cyclase